MLDAAQPDEAVRVLPQLGGGALQDLHLQAEVLVEVHVQRGQDPGVVGVATLHQLLGELPLLVVVGAVGVSAIPGPTAGNLALITPTLFLVFLVLAVVAPLAAGGGNSLFPEDQLVAFPVRSSTQYWGSTALAPLNLAWSVQVVVLIAGITVVTRGAALVPVAVGTALLFITAATLTGQSVGWVIVGARATRTGRVIVWSIGGILVLAAAWIWRTDAWGAALDASPVFRVVDCP